MEAGARPVTSSSIYVKFTERYLTPPFPFTLHSEVLTAGYGPRWFTIKLKCARLARLQGAGQDD